MMILLFTMTGAFLNAIFFQEGYSCIYKMRLYETNRAAILSIETSGKDQYAKSQTRISWLKERVWKAISKCNAIPIKITMAFSPNRTNNPKTGIESQKISIAK